MPPRINNSLDARVAAATLSNEIDDAGVGPAPASVPPAAVSTDRSGPLDAVQALSRPGSPQPQAGFNDVGIHLISRIGNAFAMGSRDVSRLCGVSRTFQSALTDRAFADKLCAEVASPLPHADVSQVYRQLIVQSERLPPPLRAKVLAVVIARLPVHLQAPVAGLDGLLGNLLQAIQSVQEPRQQVQLLVRMGAMFKNADFRWQCFESIDPPVLKPAMAVFYQAFTAATQAVLPACVNSMTALADATAGSPAARSFSGQKMFASLYRMLAGGLFLVAEPQARHRAWHDMHQDKRCGSGDARLELLKGLSEEMVMLAQPQQRQAAFLQVLNEVATLSATIQPAMIRRLAGQLRMLDSQPVFSATLCRLCELAMALPSDEACLSICDIVRTVPGMSNPERREIAFDLLLEAIRSRPPKDRADMMPSLASRILCLEQGQARVIAFDALWSEVQRLDAALQKATVRRLIRALDALPAEPAEIRQLRFTDAIDFTRSVAPEAQFALVSYLIERIDAVPGADLQMAAFYNVLDLVAAQVPSRRAHLLKEMHSSFNFANFDNAVDDTTRFAMASALGWAAARLPPQNHADLLAEFTSAAIWYRAPFMGRQCRSIVNAAERLPEQVGRNVMEHLCETLARRVEQILVLPDEDLPPAFSTFLDTADQLPTEMRIRLLQEIAVAVSGFPAPNRALAQAEFLEHLHGVPSEWLAAISHFVNASVMPVPAGAVPGGR